MVRGPFAVLMLLVFTTAITPCVGASYEASTGAPTLIAGVSAMPIPAWLDFCNRYPAECTIDSSEPATIALTQERLAVLTAINRRVNQTIRPMTDMEHWGVSDRWDIPTDGYGDCEDFQLLKRKLLVKAGFPRRAMRMTVVSNRGEGHAVLLVSTDRGDLVLDNKSSVPVAWHQTGYRFLKRESEHTLEWMSLTSNFGRVGTAAVSGRTARDYQQSATTIRSPAAVSRAEKRRIVDAPGPMSEKEAVEWVRTVASAIWSSRVVQRLRGVSADHLASLPWPTRS